MRRGDSKRELRFQTRRQKKKKWPSRRDPPRVLAARRGTCRDRFGRWRRGGPWRRRGRRQRPGCRKARGWRGGGGWWLGRPALSPTSGDQSRRNRSPRRCSMQTKRAAAGAAWRSPLPAEGRRLWGHQSPIIVGTLLRMVIGKGWIRQSGST